MQDSSANFRTICHALGLSAQALADWCSVERRTASHWFSTGHPPAGVFEQVQRLDAMIDNIITEVVDLHADASDEAGPPQQVELYAWRTEEDWHAAHPEFEGLPIQTHSIMLRRTQQALQRIGVKALITYFPEN